MEVLTPKKFQGGQGRLSVSDQANRRKLDIKTSPTRRGTTNGIVSASAIPVEPLRNGPSCL